MKTTKIILASAVALTLTFGSAVSGIAHTGHDHSNLPLKWVFAKGTAEKVAETLESGQNTKIKGLSKFEQKKLDHYGIKVGNTFKSLVDGQPVKIKRTTTGIEIERTSPVDLASVWKIPLRKSNAVVLASTGTHHHPGHDHSTLPYEWEFSAATENKIYNRMANTVKGGFVGLTHFEQKLMDRYGIKVGNKFNSVIDGQKVLVERTSGGIRATNSGDNMSIASSMGNSTM